MESSSINLANLNELDLQVITAINILLLQSQATLFWHWQQFFIMQNQIKRLI